LAAVTAALADETGFALLVDLRPCLVIIDRGKDPWEDDAHGLELVFTDLAGYLQTAARDLGRHCGSGPPRLLSSSSTLPTSPRSARSGSPHSDTHDWQAGVSDIDDPRRPNPVLVFPQLDASETERRRQRNRVTANWLCGWTSVETGSHDRRSRWPASGRVGGSLAGSDPEATN